MTRAAIPPTAIPPTAALRTKLALASPVIAAAAAELWQRPGLAGRYARYLGTMHAVIRASVPLMAAGADRCAELGDGDPLAAPLGEYLVRHIAEERGHDDWLLDDLAAMGVDAASEVSRRPPLAVARLVGPQYYWIRHHHPIALLGYIAVLESNAPSTGLGDWIVAATGLPEAAVRTVRAHAELDSGHAESVFELLDSLPVTPELLDVVAVNALHTAEALIGVFAHIVTTGRSTEGKTT